MKRYLIFASGAILAGALVWLGLGTPFLGESGEKDDGAVLGACGAEYVEFTATDVARPGFPEGSSTPFAPSDPACKSAMATANAAPSPTPPPAVLLDEFGSYTLSDLGYSEITLHSWEPGIIGVIPGLAPERYANVVVEYLLPEDAAQGEGKWYVLHLHLEVEFADGVDGGRATVSASPNRGAVAAIDFKPGRDNGTLHVDSSGVDEAEQHGNKVEAHFTNYFSNAAVVPGLNRLVFAVRERDGATVQTLRVFDDTAIEVTSVSPSELMRQRESERPEDYCDLEDPDCIAEIVSRPDFLEDPGKYCDFADPGCVELMLEARRARQPTPVPLDPRVEEVFMQDPAIRAMIGDGERGLDYWVRFTPLWYPGHGDEPGSTAMMELVFAEPVSYEGEVGTASDPCKGHGDEGRVDPGDPCLDEEREFGAVNRAFSEATVIFGRVYARQGFVANMYQQKLYPDMEEALKDSIIEGSAASP